MKRLGPISADCHFAPKLSGTFSNQCGDDRGRHFKVVLVMSENAFEIMGIPCSNPLLGKAFGKTLLHQALFRLRPTGIVACCARAASGHAAAPPRSVMNSRRFTPMSPVLRPKGNTVRRAGDCCTAGFQCGQ